MFYFFYPIKIQSISEIAGKCNYENEKIHKIETDVEILEILKLADTDVINAIVCVCVGVLAAQLCPTLCDSMDCSSPGSSVHGLLQSRILEWNGQPFSSSRNLPYPEIEFKSPVSQADSLPSKPPGKPKCYCKYAQRLK